MEWCGKSRRSINSAVSTKDWGIGGDAEPSKIGEGGDPDRDPHHPSCSQATVLTTPANKLLLHRDPLKGDSNYISGPLVFSIVFMVSHVTIWNNLPEEDIPLADGHGGDDWYSKCPSIRSAVVLNFKMHHAHKIPITPLHEVKVSGQKYLFSCIRFISWKERQILNKACNDARANKLGMRASSFPPRQTHRLNERALLKEYYRVEERGERHFGDREKEKKRWDCL